MCCVVCGYSLQGQTPADRDETNHVVSLSGEALIFVGMENQFFEINPPPPKQNKIKQKPQNRQNKILIAAVCLKLIFSK